MSSSGYDDYSKLRSLGNEYFIQGNFALAEDIYSEILQKFDNDTSIILTNRSAARLSLGKVNGALDDAEKAIEKDRKWMKAYYRKASALEILQRHKDVYETWMEAAAQCGADTSPWLSKQLRLARTNWTKKLKDVPISDMEDFITRYEMLSDSREKLSTMAHFWNDSTLAERFQHFKFLIALIGNGNDPSMQTKDITEENMPEMPLHNYEDLTRAAIAHWCDFFVGLDSELKTKALERMWLTLSNSEQGLVITDLRQFVFLAMKSESDAQVAACRSAAPMS